MANNSVTTKNEQFSNIVWRQEGAGMGKTYEVSELGDMLIYQNEKGDTKVDVYFYDKDIWMSQAAIAQMYNTTPQNITMHIKNIYKDGELDEDLTCKEFLQVQTEGTRQIKRNKKHYNFRMILAIGYRVRSNVGVHGHTAAELIMQRADAAKDNMGLTAFEGAKVRKKDVDIAKNYLNEEEMSELNRVVTMYLDFAEDQARRHIPMYMKDWEEKLNSFLNMTGREVLSGAGHVSAEQAKRHALEQYKIYDEHRAQIQEEQLIEQAKGKLWMCYLNNDEKALQIEEKYKITSKQFVEGGVRYKILCEEKPFEDAKIAEVSLEDGYIYVNMKK